MERSAAGGRNPWIIAVVISIATFMEVLDTSIANVALRHIAGGLAASQDESSWVLTSYLVSNAVILPVSGWLSSVIGRKRFYMMSVALFTVSSLGCALSTSLGMLIGFRVLQGLGGGGLAPSEQSMLADSFPPAKRGLAFAVYGVAVIVAPTIGPTLGGWITDHSSWHWIFLINIPVGIASLLLVQWLVHEPAVLEKERKALVRNGIKVDYIGFALVALWLGCLEVVLDRGQIDDWFSSPFIVVFSILSALALILLIPWELLRKDPIFDVGLIFRRQFGTSCFVMLAVGMILFGSTQFIPQLLQENYGYNATWSGLALMPGGVVMLFLVMLAGRLTSVIQPKYLITFGMAVIALSLYHMAHLTPEANYSTFAWARIYQTIGLPFIFIPITAASYDGLPPEKTGQAASLINVARNLGGSIGISMATTVLDRREQFHQSRLSEHIASTSLTYQNTLNAMTSYFNHQPGGAGDANSRAIALIGQTVQTQASLLSYFDVFMMLGVIAAIASVLTLIVMRHVDMNKSHAG
ncbi:DHA2 family efflux MFS transporter permease subunit [Faunimonas pinastri]|nr:DHA2 family efflux MFS transporter permease subunit [Faunimonas pinastri]